MPEIGTRPIPPAELTRASAGAWAEAGLAARAAR